MAWHVEVEVQYQDGRTEIVMLPDGGTFTPKEDVQILSVSLPKSDPPTKEELRKLYSAGMR